MASPRAAPDVGRGPLRWRVVALLAVLGLLACAPCCPAGTADPSTGATSPGAITVATFNVYHPASSDRETLEAIGETGADLVLLQEVSPSWQQVLEQRYGERYPHRFFAAAGGAGGLGVLSRYPLSEASVLPAVVKHPAALVRVRAPAGEFQVLDVHLRSVFTRRGKTFVGAFLSVGADHVQELRAFMPEGPELPTLVVGDFNESGGGPAVEWLERRGFVNALPRHCRGPYTWRALGGQLRLALDHILFDGGFESLDAWVVHQGRSDHLPVVARLALRART